MKLESKTLSPSLAFKAAGYASEGIWHALRNEPAFKRIVIGDVIIGAALVWYLFPLSIAEAGLLVIVAFLPLMTEIINTGFEAFVDRMHPEMHDSVKIAKDCFAGATLLAISAGIIICALMVLMR